MESCEFRRVDCQKNALLSGSDGGGEHWAVVVSPIETCKLWEPFAYLADVITRIVNGDPNSQIVDLMAWDLRSTGRKTISMRFIELTT